MHTCVPRYLARQQRSRIRVPQSRAELYGDSNTLPSPEVETKQRVPAARLTLLAKYTSPIVGVKA